MILFTILTIKKVGCCWFGLFFLLSTNNWAAKCRQWLETERRSADGNKKRGKFSETKINRLLSKPARTHTDQNSASSAYFSQKCRTRWGQACWPSADALKAKIWPVSSWNVRVVTWCLRLCCCFRDDQHVSHRFFLAVCGATSPGKSVHMFLNYWSERTEEGKWDRVQDEQLLGCGKFLGRRLVNSTC